MLISERHAKIEELLMKRGFVRVEELVDALKVSDMTIRRDLEKCQQTGILRRCHGGATLVRANLQEVNYEDRSVDGIECKRQLASICLKYIENCASVYLDAGTTSYELAQLIKDYENLTVVTNDIRIAHSLLDTKLELILIGGGIQKSTGSIFGQMAEEMLSGMHLDVAFLGASAINEKLEVMSPTLSKAFFKRRVTEQSGFCYLVVDDSKFYHNALYKTNHLADYTGVITNFEFNQWELEEINKNKINVIPMEES
jgi:DeoR/GlpR family transcriptional regulator of sugar metabolism